MLTLKLNNKLMILNQIYRIIKLDINKAIIGIINLRILVLNKEK